MRYQAVEFEFGPHTLSRMSDDLLRRWQETVDDAQATVTKATAIANPMDAWSLQMEFGMRNAQRWLAWAENAAATSAAPIAEPAPMAPANVEPVNLEPVDTTPVNAEPAEMPAPTAVKVPLASALEAAQPLATEPVAIVEFEEETAPATDVAPMAEPMADDLKRIRGIGPAIAAKLAARGLTSFAQMAALETSAVAELDTALDLKGRIERDDWIGQAETLASTV